MKEQIHFSMSGIIPWAVLLLASFFYTFPSYSEHPIDVEQSAAKGEFFQALSIFEKIPSRRANISSVIAAGKSAWALSLPERASLEFDRALREKNLSQVQRARLLLSRGIIEYQENRPQVAILFSEKGLGVLAEPSPLRANLWLLWGESLAELGSYALAEEKYIKALDEAASDSTPDIAFKLATCELRLGKFEEARKNFERVPLSHERAPLAMRALASIALERREFSQATFWLEKGREDFSEYFLDSWVDYALVEAAIHERKPNRVKQLQEEASKKYPPSDNWLILLSASSEAFLWEASKHEVSDSTTNKEGI